MVVDRRMRLVGLAMIVMAMTPKDKLFKNEERQNTEQDGRRHALGLAMLQGMRQYFQKSRTQERPDCVGNQDIYAMYANGKGHRCRSSHAEQTARQGNDNNPG